MFGFRLRQLLLLFLIFSSQASAVAHEFQHETLSVDNSCVLCLHAADDDHLILVGSFILPVVKYTEAAQRFNYQVQSNTSYTSQHPRAPPITTS